MNAALDPIRRHWLWLANLAVGVFVALPLLAPVLMATGHDELAAPLYAGYHYVCHQWAFRSYFLFGPAATYSPDVLGALLGDRDMYLTLGSPELGYKVAFCERDLAIYLTVLLSGLAYGRLRGRLSGLNLAGYALMILPMALDGFSQLFGWHESTPLLRGLTGALFGLASVWLIYPRIDDVLGERPAQPLTALAPSRGLT
jgi:uncharacterized membrane protein